MTGIGTARLSRARKIGAVLTVVVATGALLTACTGGGSAGTKSTTLTIAAASAPGSFDPTKDSNGGTQTMYQELAYQSLIEKDSSGKYVPGLATKWGYEQGKEGLKFDLTLRSGAKFADGTPVDATAVANSLNFFIKTATGPSAGSFKALSAAAEGTDTVVITSSTPNPTIAELLTPYNLGGNIISAAGLAAPDKLANATYGAGPYIYQPSQSTTNDHYTFTPNKNYYDQKRIHFQKVVIKVIANNTSALSALRSGQINLYNGDTTQVAQAKSAGVTITQGVSAFTGMFFLDWGGKITPALGNQQVRQAMEYAVDRKAITKAVLGDYGTPTVQPNTPGWDAYDKSLNDAYPYDVAKAKKLLADAGYAGGFSFDVVYTAFDPVNTKVIQALADQWSKIGITANLKATQNFSELGTELGTKKYGGLSLGWGGQTQFANTNQLWTKTSPVNPLANSIPELDSAFDAYKSSTDADRTAAAQKVEKVVVDQALAVPVSQLVGLWFSSKTLQNFKLDPTGNPNNIADWTLG